MWAYFIESMATGNQKKCSLHSNKWKRNFTWADATFGGLSLGKYSSFTSWHCRCLSHIVFQCDFLLLGNCTNLQIWLFQAINNIWFWKIKMHFPLSIEKARELWIHKPFAAYTSRRAVDREGSCTHSNVGARKPSPAEEVNEPVEAGQPTATLLLPFSIGGRLDSVQVIDWSHCAKAYHIHNINR